MSITRRGFVGGALAFGTVGGPTAVSAREDTRPPNLRFGVVSDIHIGGKPDAAQQLEKVLRWFASERVDAVLCPGDIAHSGNIRELDNVVDRLLILGGEPISADDVKTYVNL